MTGAITKTFCTFKDSYVVLEVGKNIICERLVVGEDMNKCTLIEFEISSKFLKWDGPPPEDTT